MNACYAIRFQRHRLTGMGQQQLERIATLPKAQQRFVMQMLDTVLQQQGG